jgi:hypothetical protein
VAFAKITNAIQTDKKGVSVLQHTLTPLGKRGRWERVEKEGGEWLREVLVDAANPTSVGGRAARRRETAKDSNISYVPHIHTHTKRHALSLHMSVV